MKLHAPRCTPQAVIKHWCGLLIGMALIQPGFAATAGDAGTATARQRARNDNTIVAVSRIFELRRIAAPLCSAEPQWDWVQQLILVRKPERWAFSTDRALAEILNRHFEAKPGELIVLVDQRSGSFKLPGGLKAGDRILAADASEAELLIRRPLEGEFHADTQERLRRANEWARSQPSRTLQLIRQGQTLKLDIEPIPICAMRFGVVNSETAYAAARSDLILVTHPLLEQLSADELTMVLAHEAAQVLLALTDPNKPTNWKSGAWPLLGGNSQWNRELGLGAPTLESLIEADRLTVMLLEPFGLGPQEYLEFLARVQAAEPGGMFRPTYANLRPVAEQRLEAVRSLHANRQAEGRWTLKPQGISEAAFRAFLDHLGNEQTRIKAQSNP
ncbi:hypothetical protein [Inhella proteolytica]|uniref:Peptidase M48 domain-containing protein n=1 Tax=Inhella proteolytica TaxID=2795029 RepID=A0A931J3A5_9BURK|nr:hypothetical protein [Inhella proteolytica]MBH9576958.1 hypothetical protein [Inhella proteolytica]